jgi:hypothetical protein
LFQRCFNVVSTLFQRCFKLGRKQIDKSHQFTWSNHFLK